MQEKLDLWFTERHSPSLGITLKVREVLHRETTPYQDLAVLDTYQYGRLLALDGVIQTTERDEFVYHEMIAHVPLFSHPDPREVLVVGGGDGGVVREVLKHPGVQRAVLVEIDRAVVEASRAFLPSISSGLDDPRVELVVADGIEYVRGTTAAFDVVIVDSTDPVGPAVGLFSGEFYGSVRRALREGGIMVAQTDSPFTAPGRIREVLAAVRGHFPVARTYLASVPTYPAGLWAFTAGSTRVDPAVPSRMPPAGFQSRYYTSELHRAAFVLPRFVAELSE